MQRLTDEQVLELQAWMSKLDTNTYRAFCRTASEFAKLVNISYIIAMWHVYEQYTKERD